jgi:hypothetical protein
MPKQKLPSQARLFGYGMAILVNFVLIYVANNLLAWNIPFLTTSFSSVLWAINLSLGVSIFINFIFLFFDRRWFKNFMQAFGNIFSFLSGFIFLRVFPLKLSAGLANIVHFAIIVFLGLLAISTMIELLGAVRNYNKQ